MTKTRLGLVIALVLYVSDARADKAELQERMRSHPARQAASWPDLSKDGPPQIEAAPKMVVDYVLLDNRLNGFRELPKPLNDITIVRDVRRAWDTIPQAVRSRVAPRIAGIFIVRDLGGSAFTEVILDGGRIVGAFLVLDGERLGVDANRWMTWKESTPFANGTDWLRARIAPEGASDRVAGLRYVLLHEFGHVLGAPAGAHPEWKPGGVLPKFDLADYPFLAISWKRRGDGLVVKEQDRRPVGLRYYAGPRYKLTNRQILPSYRWLESSSFATLYSTNSVWDDFAEAFANYVHVVMLKQPYAIDVVNAEGVLLRYGPCWKQERCSAKRKFLEDYLRPSPASKKGATRRSR